MTLFKQTAGVIQSMEEQTAIQEEVVLPEGAQVAVAPVDQVAVVPVAPQVPVAVVGHKAEQATRQVVLRGPSCR